MTFRANYAQFLANTSDNCRESASIPPFRRKNTGMVANLVTKSPPLTRR